jgi:hypothetical protein
MNDRLGRLGTLWLLVIGAAALTLALYGGPDAVGQDEQSPVSPLPLLPWAPAPEPVSGWERFFGGTFWRSPLPWVAMGLILFGALAWVLVRAIRRFWPQEDDRRGPFDPTGRAG